ncbi:MAG: AtpZ/AtpI family protein [Bacteroidota bacterium]
MSLQKPRKRSIHKYAWYTSVALQMLAIILLFTYAGVKLDAWIHIKIPIFTVILSLSGVVIAIYQVTKDLLRKK